jgi:hypothetical protein
VSIIFLSFVYRTLTLAAGTLLVLLGYHLYLKRAADDDKRRPHAGPGIVLALFGMGIVLVAALRPPVADDRSGGYDYESPAFEYVPLDIENAKYLPHVVGENDTLAIVAGMYGSHPKWVTAANEGLDSDEDLMQSFVGKEIAIPVQMTVQDESR